MFDKMKMCAILQVEQDELAKQTERKMNMDKTCNGCNYFDKEINVCTLYFDHLTETYADEKACENFENN